MIYNLYKLRYVVEYDETSIFLKNEKKNYFEAEDI